jgi:hypothetical protein
MCRKVPELVPRFLSGELSISESRRLELHLSICDACRIRATQEGYKTAPQPKTSDTQDGIAVMRVQLASQLNTPAPIQVRPSLSVGWIVAGVVVCVGIAAVLLQLT